MTLQRILVLSAVTASISFTLADAALFRPLRVRAARLGQWPGKLAGCGYCVAHWVGVGVYFLTRPSWDLDALLTMLVIIWLACLQWAVMAALVKAAGK